ncbi:MAG: 16S rRNA (guanine(527)-N(7))-methyltransferase RsmG [Clostridiales Family XIII bacterium]|jgi:16S rRNA (guanine527-N7)-methyltransferase|nr:16S rRNA (guanine(527)-N(7))-methyltransferase RsmG [Clostridiales Family XIII bacterium]
MIDEKVVFDCREILKIALAKLGVSDVNTQNRRMDKLMLFMELVLERNEVINLTNITEPEEFTKLHLVDSLACFGYEEIEKAHDIVDVGAGPGFPGIPLAIMYPYKSFVLADSLEKRTLFITEAAEKLGLENIKAIHARAETLGQDRQYRESFDLSVCRAVAAMPVLMEYTLPLIKVNGSCYAYKTITAEGEIEDSELARELLGGSKAVEVRRYAELLPGRNHAIYVIGKERPTPKSYPRKEGTAKRVPL